MPSESDKWKDRATIFKPSETAEIKAVSDPEETDSEYWMSKSTLWKPLKRAYRVAASVSDLYPHFFQEDTGVRFRLVSVGIPPIVVREEEDQVRIRFHLQSVDVKEVRTEYNATPDLTEVSFQLNSVRVIEELRPLPEESISLRFGLVGVQVAEGVTHRIGAESVGITFSLMNVDVWSE